MNKNKTNKTKKKPATKLSPKTSNKLIIAILIVLSLSIIIFLLALQEKADLRQRADSPEQKVTVDACIPSGGSCKPVGGCASNEPNLGTLDCGGGLTCCKLAAAVPTNPPDSDIDGSNCRAKGGLCQQKGFCSTGVGGAEEDCSNDGSNWCCMPPGASPVPSPGCLGSCPVPTAMTTDQPEPSGIETTEEPSLSGEPSTEPTDAENPGENPPGNDGDNGNNGGNTNGFIGFFLAILIAILEFFARLFGRN